jgi:hypothetical protein
VRLLLPILVVTCLVSTVLFFPLGYKDEYTTILNVAPFSLSNNSSSLATSENLNLNSGQWSLDGPQLSIRADGVVDPQIWAILTVRAAVFFPPLVGTQLVFSGSFSGLNLTSSAIRVYLVLTYLSHVVTIYYLVGDSSIPSNTGSYSLYRITIPSNGTTFSARRDIVQDLSSQGAGVDVGWEIRSISLGFVIYPSASNPRGPVQVTFNSNETALLLSGNGANSSYSSTYNQGYYLAPILLLTITTFLYASEPIVRRVLGSIIHPSSTRQGETS